MTPVPKSRIPKRRPAEPGLFLALAVLLVTGCDCAPEPPSQPDPQGQGALVDEATDIGDPPLPGIQNVSTDLRERLQVALTARGSDYEPRTHHLVDGAPEYTNRLMLETSPYLVQHAHNPVNWFPWGDEAFAKALREGKPILLSVGYSTCHWCHVMERESFENVVIATFINEQFVAIKFDREERPDIDDIYMRAVQIMTGRGGWPMTVVLTPDRQPFFGGTYFPPTDGARGARRGFLSILRMLSERYQTDREQVVTQAASLSARIARLSQPAPPGNVPPAGAIAGAVRALTAQYEPRFGGFGNAPKFPQPSRLLLLLRYHRRTDDPVARQMVEETLSHMKNGGMYDHVGGGFHRYSTDDEWLVPHFEKMLYDNAQLTVAYLEGYQLTGRDDFATVAKDTLDYVTREMVGPAGGFYSATDADSDTPAGHQEEGWFFTWTPAELEEVLGAELAGRVRAYYGVEEGGNFEGRSILHTRQSLSEVATELGIAPGVLQAELDIARQQLYAARDQRPKPLRDDKVLTAWNGLMISAFARGALILGESSYATTGARAARFLWDELRDENGRLLRSHMDGEPRHRAYLDDHAFLIRALLDLYEATGALEHLDRAQRLQAALEEHYGADSGGYFMTAHDHEELLVRDQPADDGALPSGNGVTAENLLRLHEFTQDDGYRTRAERLFSAFAGRLRRGAGMPRMLSALDFYLDVPREVVLVDGAEGQPLRTVLRRTFLPNRVLAVLSPAAAGEQAARIPWLAGKVAIEHRATAYVCEQGRCELPTSDPRELARQLGSVRPLTDPPPPALSIPEPPAEPEPWFFDRANNRYWNPIHRHWHDGPPPQR
ncbi:MAG: thioredoxin domain-containing protein [Myxococcota bacterium]